MEELNLKSGILSINCKTKCRNGIVRQTHLSSAVVNDTRFHLGYKNLAEWLGTHSYYLWMKFITYISVLVFQPHTFIQRHIVCMRAFHCPSMCSKSPMFKRHWKSLVGINYSSNQVDDSYLDISSTMVQPPRHTSKRTLEYSAVPDNPLYLLYCICDCHHLDCRLVFSTYSNLFSSLCPFGHKLIYIPNKQNHMPENQRNRLGNVAHRVSALGM